MMKAVEGEGLPRLKQPFDFGNLFICFSIKFPDELGPDAQAGLAKLLGPPMHVPTAKEDDEDVEVVQLKDIDPLISFKSYQPHEEHDDDDEGGPGGQRVQCAQQ